MMPEPRCFLHMPKCAGTSVHVALEASFPQGAVASRRGDTAIFCNFTAFDELPDTARSLVAVGDAEIAELTRYQVISGHFSLPTLLRVTSPSSIATVLREPRARLISAFMFIRLTPIVAFWGPYGREVLAGAAKSLEACLLDERAACSTDNQVCRLLLHGDPRLSDDKFIAPAQAESLAAAALDQLDQLGLVGILELGIWDDLSEFFGRPLEATRANVSGADEVPEGALPVPESNTRVVLELIAQRSLADRIVYDTLVERRCGDREETRRIADAAFATELMRFGDMAGTSATKLGQLQGRLAETGQV